MKRTILVPMLLCMLATGAAHGYEFKSVGPAPAILYDAPGQNSKKLFIAPSGMPVEIVLVSRSWSKVRDANGALAWVESKALTAKRGLIVKVARVKVRQSAADNAATVFSADKGVLLEWVEPATSGWIKARHRDGQSGFVRINEVWGE